MILQYLIILNLLWLDIDEFNYRAWHFITSFIGHVIQIYVEQKATESIGFRRISLYCITVSSWRVLVLEEFLYTALLYQTTNTRNINVLAILKQYLVLVKKEQWGDFPVQSDFVSA